MCTKIGHEFTYELRSIRDISTHNEYIHSYVSYASEAEVPTLSPVLRKPPLTTFFLYASVFFLYAAT